MKHHPVSVIGDPLLYSINVDTLFIMFFLLFHILPNPVFINLLLHAPQLRYLLLSDLVSLLQVLLKPDDFFLLLRLDLDRICELFRDVLLEFAEFLTLALHLLLHGLLGLAELVDIILKVLDFALSLLDLLAYLLLALLVFLIELELFLEVLHLLLVLLLYGLLLLGVSGFLECGLLVVFNLS